MDDANKKDSFNSLIDIANNFQDQYQLASFYNQSKSVSPPVPAPVPPPPAHDDSDNKENVRPSSSSSENLPPSFLPFDPSRYKYQMRKPVESWKYAEVFWVSAAIVTIWLAVTAVRVCDVLKSIGPAFYAGGVPSFCRSIRKSDGSSCYQCRVCASSYKHKKSLNKHWRDKHSNIPRPEGAPDDDDDDEDDMSEPDLVPCSPPREQSPPRMPLSAPRPMGRQSMFASYTPASLTAMSLIKRELSPINSAPKRRHSVLPEPPKPPPNSFPSFQTMLNNMFQPRPISENPLPQPLDLTVQQHERENVTGPQNLNLSVMKALLQSVLNSLEQETAATCISDLSPPTQTLLQAVGSFLTLACSKKENIPPPPKPQVPPTPPPPLDISRSNEIHTNAQFFSALDINQIMSAFPHTPIIGGSSMNQPHPQHSSVFNPKRPLYRHSISHAGRNMMVPNLPKFGHVESAPKEGRRSASQDPDTGPISCKLCNFEARWFSELRAHMVNHSEHRMFGCCYCIYRAKWKWDVAKHMRRCALARHVAHLPNESLLRMVKYLPPPPTDILYEFFPKNSYPGVGTERPVTPPQFARMKDEHRSTPSSMDDPTATYEPDASSVSERTKNE
ncbi:hypothetical protein Ciccas_008850 [Cichlidogyrus casuarinus]|uniref:C2H2-type domain-containing protein n=1 Tax=Cichlidogyrus casuarinus TaxID=1844966 RepID=A0ABD2PYQ5_9PLAT